MSIYSFNILKVLILLTYLIVFSQKSRSLWFYGPRQRRFSFTTDEKVFLILILMNVRLQEQFDKLQDE